MIGSIEIEEKKELVYLMTPIPNANDPNAILNSITVTPTMRSELTDTHVTIAGTIGTLVNEVESLVRTFGLAYVKKPHHPIVALTEKSNRCSVTLRSRGTSLPKLQTLLCKVEEVFNNVLNRVATKSQVEFQVWYSFAPLLGLPTGSVTFVDLPYSIDSNDKKEEAFRIHNLLNKHRLLNAFYTNPGKYLRIYATPYQFQKVVMELREEHFRCLTALRCHTHIHIPDPTGTLTLSRTHRSGPTCLLMCSSCNPC